MQLLVPDQGELLKLIPLFCRVQPLQRPRLNFYSKKVYQPLENQKELIAEMMNHKPDSPIDQPCFVSILVNVEKVAKNSKNPWPTKNDWGDVDNLAKAVNDAMMKADIILDDNLIVGMRVTKAYGMADQALVGIFSVTPSKQRVVTCDLNSASISSKPLVPASETSTQGTPPSPSCPLVQAKQRS